MHLLFYIYSQLHTDKTTMTPAEKSPVALTPPHCDLQELNQKIKYINKPQRYDSETKH